METRVAVLEQIAKDTKDTLVRMEGRLDRMEDHQRKDFRTLFAALIAVALGLAGLMARGFHWL